MGISDRDSSRSNAVTAQASNAEDAEVIALHLKGPVLEAMTLWGCLGQPSVVGAVEPSGREPLSDSGTAPS
jgi:hypothetical protein